MDHYPGVASPDKYIFPTKGSNGAKYLGYEAVRYAIKEARITAGIEKHITPHIFRHTRITDLMRMGVSEQSIKMMAWGTVTTNMLRVYAHLTPTDAENEMNQHMKITKKDKTAELPDIVTPIQCEKCGLVNPKSSQFCMGCGSPTSKDSKAKHNEVMQFLQNEEFHTELLEFIQLKMLKK
jgi:predicted Zn-ribbon and HTH transcriptional regulator